MKYNNRKSHRINNWDYTGVGCYFITMMVQNRKPILGSVECKENQYSVKLTAIGEIVKNELLRSESIRKEITIDEFIIMPNHIHFIIFFKKERHALGLVTEKPVAYLPNKSLGSFILGFKSSVNSKVDDWIDLSNSTMSKFNKKNPFFQRNYYERKINSENVFRIIQLYIRNNPKKWYLKFHNSVK